MPTYEVTVTATLTVTAENAVLAAEAAKVVRLAMVPCGGIRSRGEHDRHTYYYRIQTTELARSLPKKK